MTVTLPAIMPIPAVPAARLDEALEPTGVAFALPLSSPTCWWVVRRNDDECAASFRIEFWRELEMYPLVITYADTVDEIRDPFSAKSLVWYPYYAPDLSDDDSAAWEEAKDRYLAGRDAYQRRDIEALRKIPGYHPMAELPGSPQRFRADVFYGSKQRFEKRADIAAHARQPAQAACERRGV